MAGESLGEAFVEIRPRTDGFARDLNSQVTQAGNQAATAGGTAGAATGGRFRRGFSTSMAGFGRSIAGFFAVSQVTQFLGAAITEATEANRVLEQTGAVIESTGGAANVSADDLSELADRISRVAAVDDDLVQSAGNVLLTFTRVRNEVGEGNDVFDQALEATADLSAALGTDLQSATLLVGKALNDPIAGLTALQRSGVQFTDQQKEMIRALVESGDVLGAQRIILAELETQFGGSAEAGATSTEKWNVAVDSLKESVGEALLPAVERATPVIEDFADTLAEADETTQSLYIYVGLLAVGVVTVGAVFGSLAAGVALLAGVVIGLGLGIKYIADNWEYAGGLADLALVGMKNGLRDVIEETPTLIGRLAVIGTFAFPLPIAGFRLLRANGVSARDAASGLLARLREFAGIVVGTLGVPNLAGALRAAQGPASSLLSTLRAIANVDLSKAAPGGLGLPKRAAGGTFPAGGVLVGDGGGPELLFASRAGYIASTQDTARLARSGGASPAPVAAVSAREIGAEVARALAADPRAMYVAVAGAGRPYERGSRGARERVL